MQTGVQSSRNALLMSFKRTDPFLVTRRSLGDHVGPTSRRSSSAASFTSTGSIGTKAGVENDSEVSQQELIIMEDDRPQTALERIKNFPRGVKMFLHDCLRYKHINDASRTPLNAWTINHPLRPRKDIRDFFVYDNELCPGRIPRRQYQLQRRLRNELRSVVPLIIVWIPPIIGFIPPLLAVLAPRQVMSHHFHNHYELRAFAQIEYRQRRSVFDDVAAHFSSAFRMNIQVPLSGGGRSIEEDGAGPITDPLAIYAAFADHPTGPPPSLEIPRGIYTSVNDIPRDYLVSGRSMIRTESFFSTREQTLGDSLYDCSETHTIILLRLGKIVPCNWN